MATLASSPPIAPEVITAHGLDAEDYQRILGLINRHPTLTELGIFSAMWNEHCSYKSSKKWLKTLPVSGKRVIQGPGENAGVVDIGDGQAVVFKMESHNHPSFIEPYQGAATGVGGILRDVFTMGARPVAALNALRFGDPAHPRTRYLVSGVVAGIGGYGNSFGVPTVGGEVNFHKAYNGNILVNAMAIGLCASDRIFYAKAEKAGQPVVYLGAKTGRDGIHGATMASAEFSGDDEQKRPTVQVGDPFCEKRLMEACLELMASGAVSAIQDMGAAGLTCSAVEMGAKGQLGVALDLDQAPCREEGMTAYEMMLSESQERMLMVLNPEKADQARRIFRKWALDFAVIGRTTPEKRFHITHKGVVVADLPIMELGEAAPEYDRPWLTAPAPSPLTSVDFPSGPKAVEVALLKLLGSPDLCSRRWIWEQYDSIIQSNTAQGPGGDAAVIRVLETGKAIAACIDVTPRYVAADPFEGAKQAVAEVWRNLSAVGAEPLAVTDNLNFGNPEKPDIMGSFVSAIKGIGAACRHLAFPVVSGNVSFYNETDGEPVLPTPAIGGVGLIADIARSASIGFRRDGDVILLIGVTAGHLGQSIYLREIHGREAGTPPPVDLGLEKRHGDFVRGLIAAGRLDICHDISDGGLAVALAEMVLAGGRGCAVTPPSDGVRLHEWLFGEDQARYVIACPPDQAQSVEDDAAAQGVACAAIGRVEGDGEAAILRIKGQAPISATALRRAHETWLAAFMNPTAD